MKSEGKAIRVMLLASAALFLSACAVGSGAGYPLFPGSTYSNQYQYSGFGASQFGNGFAPPSAAQEHLQGPLDTMSDQELSDRVTGYLHNNLLPLVQANVQRDANGQRKIILSGFVASTYGKNDAASKVKSYLNNPSWPITNYVRVSPNLADLNAQYRQSHQAPANNSSSASNPDNGANSSGVNTNALNAQIQLPAGAEAYIQQQQAAQAMPMMPMMPMGGMMYGAPGYGYGGGSMGFGTMGFGGFGMMPGFGFFP